MIEFLQGDCIEVMKGLQAESVDCCVTSPPYYGLRDYGHEGQIGLEQTPEEYVNKLVEVFREVRRVLRNDGTLWLNLGDSYLGAASDHKNAGSFGASSCVSDKTKSGVPTGGRAARNRLMQAGGLKPKDLIGIPWRVAFALQADGWYLRQDIIWHKPNPMPESVKDRCTKAHEYIFLFSKSPRYYFDSDAIKEPTVTPVRTREKLNGESAVDTKIRGFGSHCGTREQRNKRSVWTVTTKSYKGAHFATFPEDLIEPCLTAGCPISGTVLDPFGGAGTTGLVAGKLNLNAVLIELNPDYIKLAKERLCA